MIGLAITSTRVSIAIHQLMAGALPLFGLFYDTVAGTAFAYPLWSRTLERLPASTASLGMLLGPVFGVIASAILLEERSTAADLAGSALILATAVLALEARHAAH